MEQQIYTIVYNYVWTSLAIYFLMTLLTAHASSLIVQYNLHLHLLETETPFWEITLKTIQIYEQLSLALIKQKQNTNL